MSLDLKDAYFHIQVAPHHRRFEGVAYQYKVLPFGLSLAPRTFTQCMDAALSPLRQMRIRILNYLDDWLILAQSEAVLTSHKTLFLCHLGCLGLRVNFAKSVLSPSQRVSFLGTVIDSADESNCLSGVSHDSAPHSFLQGRKSRTPPCNGDSGLCISPGLLKGSPLAKARYDLRHGAQKEGCHDRHFQQVLGSAVRGQTDLRSLVRRGVGPRNASSVLCLSILPAGHTGTPCSSMLRQ